MIAEHEKNWGWRRGLALLAFAGFAASICVHLAACLSVNVAKHIPAVWLLHLGIFVVFVPFVFSQQREQRRNETETKEVVPELNDFSTPKAIWKQTRAMLRRVREKDPRPEILVHVPRLARSLVVVFFVYAFINFAFFFYNTHNEPRGKYVVGNYNLSNYNLSPKQGRVFVVTQEEYDKREARVLRGFTGHWMIFYLLPAVYFWFPKRGNSL
jgi:hypothetical protein